MVTNTKASEGHFSPSTGQPSYTTSPETLAAPPSLSQPALVAQQDENPYPTTGRNPQGSSPVPDPIKISPPIGKLGRTPQSMPPPQQQQLLPPPRIQESSTTVDQQLQEAAEGAQYEQTLFDSCAKGDHELKTEYGYCGIISAIVLFPIGFICLFTDRTAKCVRCGAKLTV